MIGQCAKVEVLPESDSSSPSFEVQHLSMSESSKPILTVTLLRRCFDSPRVTNGRSLLLSSKTTRALFLDKTCGNLTPAPAGTRVTQRGLKSNEGINFSF